MTDSAINPFPQFDGQHLKTIRQRRGLSQAQIAELTFININYISKLERNLINNPGINLLVKLAIVLHCSLDDLILTPKTQTTITPMQNLLVDRLRQYPTVQAEQLSSLFITTLNQIPPRQRASNISQKG